MIKVTLKDGTYLECNIYETNKSGEYPIVNHEKIKDLFTFKDGIDFTEQLIHFQTSTINGKFHVTSVLRYEITHENKYSYNYLRADGYMRDWC